MPRALPGRTRPFLAVLLVVGDAAGTVTEGLGSPSKPGRRCGRLTPLTEEIDAGITAAPFVTTGARLGIFVGTAGGRDARRTFAPCVAAFKAYVASVGRNARPVTLDGAAASTQTTTAAGEAAVGTGTHAGKQTTCKILEARTNPEH